MRPTVAFPVSPKPIEEGQELRYINEELLKILPQLRTAANALSLEVKSVTTDGTGAFFTLWTSPAMPAVSTWLILAYLTANYPATLSGGNWASILTTASFVFSNSLQGQAGAITDLFSAKAAAAINYQFALDVPSKTVSLQVRDRGLGAGVSDLKWTGVIVICEVAQ